MNRLLTNPWLFGFSIALLQIAASYFAALSDLVGVASVIAIMWFIMNNRPKDKPFYTTAFSLTLKLAIAIVIPIAIHHGLTH